MLRQSLSTMQLVGKYLVNFGHRKEIKILGSDPKLVLKLSYANEYLCENRKFLILCVTL